MKTQSSAKVQAKTSSKRVGKKRNRSLSYLNYFILSIIGMLAVLGILKLALSNNIANNIIMGDNIFYGGLIDDLLAVSSMAILFIFWLVFTGREKRKLLFFVFLNLAYFFAFYYYSVGIKGGNGEIYIESLFIKLILGLIFCFHISAYSFSHFYIRKRMNLIPKKFEGFGAKARRRYYVQKIANMSYSVSGIGIIILWALFSAILFNGGFALFLFGMSLAFFGVIYFFSWLALIALRKLAGIKEDK